MNSFMELFFPIAHRIATTMAWIDSIEAISDNAILWDGILSTTILKNTFKDMLLHSKQLILLSKNNNENLFHPKITTKSKILGKTKDIKDKELISQLITNKILNNQSINNEITQEITDNISNELNGTNLMYARSFLSQLKRKETKDNIINDIMSNCTFQPNIVTSKFRSTNKIKQTKMKINQTKNLNENVSMNELTDHNDNEVSINSEIQNESVVENIIEIENDNIDDTCDNETIIDNNTNESTDPNQKKKPLHVHERLYNYKDRKIQLKNIPEMSEKLKQEMIHCTFQPKLLTKNKYKPIFVDVSLTPTFSKTVERMKHAYNEKLKKKELDEIDIPYNDIKYHKTRELLAKGPVPFKLLTDQRNQQKIREGVHKKPPK